MKAHSHHNHWPRLPETANLENAALVTEFRSDHYITFHDDPISALLRAEREGASPPACSYAGRADGAPIFPHTGRRIIRSFDRSQKLLFRDLSAGTPTMPPQEAPIPARSFGAGLRRPRFSLPELYRHALCPPSPLLMHGLLARALVEL